MSDSMRMSVVKGGGELIEEMNHSRQREGTVLEDYIAQRPTLKQLHDQIGEAVLLTHVIDVNNVGVAKTGCKLGFTVEETDEAIVRRQGARHHFDRAGLVQHAMVTHVDAGHAAAAELPLK
jgi:hypothetical protein